MARVTVLGGGGAVGSIATKTLAASGVFSDVVVADINVAAAKRVVKEARGAKVSAVALDAENSVSIRKAIAGSAVVLNCAGPFYKYGPIVLATVIEAGVNYVDICDDFDATEALLAMDETARDAGISALIGMGSSPGVANVLVRFCAESLLDEVEAVDIYHAHGGEKVEGAAVVKHRIHSMKMDIPMFLNGMLTTVRLFEDSGRALEEDTEFQNVGIYRVYAYPHPETITLPQYLKGVKRVTNLGLVLPPAYAELIKGMVRLGVTDEEMVVVKGREVIPLEFAVAFILRERERLLNEAGITEPMGCLKIVVKGYKGGGKETYIFSMSSRGQGMGEGTGIPAAIGAMIMATGKIKEKGVLPPEACVNPMDLLEIAKTSVEATGGKGFPIVVEHIDKDGNSQAVNLFD
ncbi:MAG: saccharopine dehydrogenase family protein [Dehalococcoidia bacterium]